VAIARSTQWALLLAFGLAVSLCFGAGPLSPTATAQIPPPPAATSGRLVYREAGAAVYQALPTLPRENQYKNLSSGQVAEDNTLADRLVRYHLFVKDRPPQYRLDWKLTLADYLGANELIEEARYPGRESLAMNPLEGDRAAIAKLTRTEREALVQALVNYFDPNRQARLTESQSPTPAPATPRPNRPQGLPGLPQPGSADLLK